MLEDGDLRAQEARFQPILPLILQHRTSSLAQYIAQYPTEEIDPLTSVSDFQSSLADYQTLRKKKERDVGLAFDRLYLAIGLKYYLDREGVGGFSAVGKKTRLSGAGLKNLYAMLARDIYSDSTYLMKKTSDSKALFQYYRLTARTPDAQALKGLEAILKDKKAPPALKYRVYFIMLYYGLAVEGSLDIRRVQQLERSYYSKVRGISVEAHVLAALSLASAYAGLREGMKFRKKPHPKYQEFLQQAARRVNRVEPSLRIKFLHDILLVWDRVASGSLRYHKPPVMLSQLQGSPFYDAVLERQSLAIYQKSLQSKHRGEVATRQRMLRPLEATYRRLLQKEDLERYQVPIYRRLLDEHQFIYRFTGNYSSFEKEIWWQIRRIEPSATGKEPSASGKEP